MLLESVSEIFTLYINIDILGVWRLCPSAAVRSVLSVGFFRFADFVDKCILIAGGIQVEAQRIAADGMGGRDKAWGCYQRFCGY